MRPLTVETERFGIHLDSCGRISGRQHTDLLTSCAPNSMLQSVLEVRMAPSLSVGHAHGTLNQQGVTTWSSLSTGRAQHQTWLTAPTAAEGSPTIALNHGLLPEAQMLAREGAFRAIGVRASFRQGPPPTSQLASAQTKPAGNTMTSNMDRKIAPDGVLSTSGASAYETNSKEEDTECHGDSHPTLSCRHKRARLR